MKDGSLLIHSLASFNCFTLKNPLSKWRQHFTKNGLKNHGITLTFLSKSSKFRAVRTIRFSSNFKYSHSGEI